MSLVLYHNPTSSNSLKVRILLAELGLDYETVEVPLAQPRPDWYLAKDPFGTVPFLVDGGYELGESNTILRYLAAREGRTDLYPDEPQARAGVDWALDALSTQIRGGLLGAERAGLMAPDGTWTQNPEDADQDALRAAIEAARRPLDLAEFLVADNGTVTGTFTIADCAFAPWLWRWSRLPVSFEAWPKLARVQETVIARPSFSAAGPVG
jgi:glutathione S-transferase